MLCNTFGWQIEARVLGWPLEVKGWPIDVWGSPKRKEWWGSVEVREWPIQASERPVEMKGSPKEAGSLANRIEYWPIEFMGWLMIPGV